MKNHIEFIITLVDGGLLRQQFDCNPDEVTGLINSGLIQLATIGHLHKGDNKFTLTCPSQFKTIEVEIPTVVLAGTDDLIVLNEKTGATK
jgi:hypothetical protein